MEDVTKCSYIGCKENREKEQILHELPVCDISLCVKWLVNSGHIDLLGRDFDTLRSIRFFICSNHFTEDSYVSKGTLKEKAVPFPHWHCISKKNVPNHPANGSHYLTGVEKGFSDESAGSDVLTNPQNLYTNRPPQSFSTHLPSSKEPVKDQWCRTCATKKLDLVSMTVKRKGTEMNLLSKLKLLIEIDEEDVLPTKMCDECIIKLEQSFKFFQQIYIADNALRQIFPSISLEKDNASYKVPEYNTQGINAPGRVHRRIQGGKRQRQQQQHQHRQHLQKHFSQKKITNTYTKPRVSAMEEKEIDDVEASEMSEKTESVTVKDGCVSNSNSVGGGTVYSLLTDTCRSDEELDWADVLKLMNRHNSLKNDKVNTHIPCEFCNAMFKFRRQLRTHLLSDHVDLSKHMCVDCVTCHENANLLIKHRVDRHGDKKYQCEKCQQEFLDKSVLMEHVRTCKENYACDSCGETFGGKHILLEHLQRPRDSSATNANDANGVPTVRNQGPEFSCTTSKLEEQTTDQSEVRIKVQEGKESDKVEVNGNECAESLSSITAPSVDTTTVWSSYENKSNHENLKLTNYPHCDNKETQGAAEDNKVNYHLVNGKGLTCVQCARENFSSPEEYERHILTHSKRQKCEED